MTAARNTREFNPVATRLLIFFGALIGGPVIGTLILTTGMMLAVVLAPDTTAHARLEAVVAWPLVTMGMAFFAFMLITPSALLSAIAVTIIVWRWGTISYAAATMIAALSVLAIFAWTEPAALNPTTIALSDAPTVMVGLAIAAALIIRWLLRHRLAPAKPNATGVRA